MIQRVAEGCSDSKQRWISRKCASLSVPSEAAPVRYPEKGKPLVTGIRDKG